MAEHVQIRALDHFTGTKDKPRFTIAVELRDRPGPAYKAGVYSDDELWFQLKGGLIVARTRVKIAWRGEYSRVEEIKKRCSDMKVPDSFWSGRPRAGYAVVAHLELERWIDPFWGGPRSYAYEWIVLEDDAKRDSWLDHREAPRGGDGIKRDFLSARQHDFSSVQAPASS